MVVVFGRLNHTLIALIPKVNNVSLMLEFLAISLCIVSYKVTTKTLVNRLKNILPFIISEEQDAFVPDRPIVNNIMAAVETMNSILGKKTGDEHLLALNLDMYKAYDRVEWSLFMI